MCRSKLVLCSVLSLQLTVPSPAFAALAQRTAPAATDRSSKPKPSQGARDTANSACDDSSTDCLEPAHETHAADGEAEADERLAPAAKTAPASRPKASADTETFDDLMRSGGKTTAAPPPMRVSVTEPDDRAQAAPIDAVESDAQLREREKVAYAEFLEGIKAIEQRRHAPALELFNSALTSLSRHQRHDRPRAVTTLQAARANHLRFEDTGDLAFLEAEIDSLTKYRASLSQWARTEPETITERGPILDKRVATLRAFIERMREDISKKSTESLLDQSLTGGTQELPNIDWDIDPVWLRWMGDPETSWAVKRASRSDMERAEPAPRRGATLEVGPRDEPRTKAGQRWILAGSTSLGIAAAALGVTISGAVISRRSNGALGSAPQDEVDHLREREDMGDNLARTGAVVAPIFLASGIVCLTMAMVERQRARDAKGVVSLRH